MISFDYKLLPGCVTTHSVELCASASTYSLTASKHYIIIAEPHSYNYTTRATVKEIG